MDYDDYDVYSRLAFLNKEAAESFKQCVEIAINWKFYREQAPGGSFSNVVRSYGCCTSILYGNLPGIPSNLQERAQRCIKKYRNL